MATVNRTAEPIERDDIVRAAFSLAALLVLTSSWLAWSLRTQDEPIAQQEPLRFLTDLNNAPESELSLLPGIGKELARRIITERETSGPFRSAGDLERVRGIGPKTIRQIEAMAIFPSSDTSAPRPEPSESP
ncbi:MAG: helix-hairpin-helix domain-containing protein [Planctomycetaceae bacterium]|nr:MAG: helix-hairpin-helix domain-containing protein [Planctomycetaceae bacterium]